MIFTRLPISVAAAGLTQIPETDIDYFVDYEPSSYDHWIFNNEAASLTGLNAGKVLTPQAGPTYAASYVTLNAAAGNALLTDLAESAGQADTVCAVFRTVQTTGLQVPFGSLGPSTDVPVSGGSPFFSGSEPSRTVFSTYRNLTSSVDLGLPIVHDNWYFLAVARDFSGATKYLKTLLGGATIDERTSAIAYVPAAAGRFIGCGNAYYNATAAGSMDFAEFMVFPRMLSAAELAALYTRRKAKMADLGITVV